MKGFLLTRVTNLDFTYLSCFFEHYLHVLQMDRIFLINNTRHPEMSCHELMTTHVPSCFQSHVTIIQNQHKQCPDKVNDLQPILNDIQRRFPHVLHSSHWLFVVDTDEYLYLQGKVWKQWMSDIPSLDTIHQLQFPWILLDHIGSRPFSSPYEMIQSGKSCPWYKQRKYHVKSMRRWSRPLVLPNVHFFQTSPTERTLIANTYLIPSTHVQPYYDEKLFPLSYSSIPVVFHLQTQSVWNMLLKIKLHTLRGKCGPSQQSLLTTALKDQRLDVFSSLYKVKLAQAGKDSSFHIPPFLLHLPCLKYHHEPEYEEHLSHLYFPSSVDKEWIESCIATTTMMTL